MVGKSKKIMKTLSKNIIQEKPKTKHTSSMSLEITELQETSGMTTRIIRISEIIEGVLVQRIIKERKKAVIISEMNVKA